MISMSKEKLADWMVKAGLATGHSETIEDLIVELDWQFQEILIQRHRCHTLAKKVRLSDLPLSDADRAVGTLMNLLLPVTPARNEAENVNG